MVLNVLVQICSIFFTALLFVFYYRRRQIYTFSNKLFGRMLFMLMSGLIFETSFVLLSLIAVNKGCYSFDTNMFLEPWSTIIVILAKCYIISLVLLTMLAYDYDVVDIYHNYNGHAFLKVSVCIILAVLPLDVYVRGGYVGLKGIGGYLSLLVVFLIIMWAFITVMRNKQSMNRVKYICINIWLVLWFIASGIQYTQNLYLVSFSCVISVFILFYEVENPDAKIDKFTGFFVSHFIFDYVKMLYKRGLSVHVGAIYSLDSTFNNDMIKSSMGDNYYACFKDTDAFCYIVTYDESILVDSLKIYQNENACVTMVYQNVVTETSLKLFLNYIKRRASSLCTSTLHIITDDNIRSLEEEDSMKMEILNALVDNRVITYIQPIYDLSTMEIISGECLCRLLGKNGDIIAPQYFIPVAERTGLIVEIESKMFRNMCKCLADERLLSSSIKYLEANLSIKKGERHDLVDEYSAILNEYNIPSYMINLEITETDVLSQKISILNNMTCMKKLGFEFSLDDFGSGESNLGYIIDMPVSVIKFDREITQKAMSDDRALTVVKNVINMVHELNIKVVVEGVETMNDVTMCKQINADYAQGYYFSKPLPMEDFLEFVKK